MASAPSTPALEGIPIELVRHIVELADPPALLALRATSTKMESKLFDLFVQQYISTRVCFVLDSSRLRSLEEIASSKTLSGHLKSLTLSLAPLYPCTQSDIHLAADSSETLEPAHLTAQEKAMALLIRDSERSHPGPVNGLKISKILRKLKAAGSCHLSLDLTTQSIRENLAGDLEDSTLSETIRGEVSSRPGYGMAYHDLLWAVVMEANYAVSSITIDDLRVIDLDMFRHARINRLQRSMSTLRKMHVIFGSVVVEHSGDGVEHRNTLVKTDCYEAQRFILQAAESLEDFKLVGDPDMALTCCDVFLQPNVVNVASLLTVRPLCKLTDLCLERISTTESVLLEMLSNSAGTLRHLSLRDIIIDASSFRGTFIELQRSCQLLGHLELQGLVTRQPSGGYASVVFDAEMRRKLLTSNRRGPVDRYFDNGVQYDRAEHTTLEIKGLEFVRAKLMVLSTAIEIREYDFEDPGVITESYEQWNQNGRGTPSRFGF